MPKYSPATILHAQRLRSNGLTYREINKSLHSSIPKGTLSGWFTNLALPSTYFERIKTLGRNNIQLAQAYNRQQLHIRLDSLRTKNQNLLTYINLPVAKLILATLYWCEGNKYPSSRNFKFGNSDPGMIKLLLTLLRRCYPIDENKFRLTLQCRADQDIALLTTFWINITHIPKTLHYHPRIDSRSLGKPTTKSSYKGVCVVDYLDASLQCELQFLGELLGSDNAISSLEKQLN